MKYIIVLSLLLIGCGNSHFCMEDLNPPPPNTSTIVSIPVHGLCVDLGNGLYVENEGNHADIYANAACNHIGPPNGVICNNLYDGDGCVIDGVIYWIEGEYGTMELHYYEE